MKEAREWAWKAVGCRAEKLSRGWILRADGRGGGGSRHFLQGRVPPFADDAPNAGPVGPVNRLPGTALRTAEQQRPCPAPLCAAHTGEGPATP